MARISAQLTCKGCQATFANRSLLDSHQRNCQNIREQSITVNNQKITLIRNENNMFTCTCDSPRCAIEYTSAPSLKRHLKAHGGQWKEVYLNKLAICVFSHTIVFLKILQHDLHSIVEDNHDDIPSTASSKELTSGDPRQLATQQEITSSVSPIF